MTNALEELNRDIWRPFVAAYGDLDIEAFLALHRADLIRISGTAGRVHGYDEYAGQMREFFATVTERGDRIRIDFRFDERITDGDLASERGLFRLSVTSPAQPPRTRYGRFHTLARNTEGRWRLVADYDPVGVGARSAGVNW